MLLIFRNFDTVSSHMNPEEQKSGFFFMTIFAIVLVAIIVGVVVYLKNVHIF